MITGARLQHPTQATGLMVKSPSLVVSPVSSLSSSTITLSSVTEPITWQAVPSHSLTTNLPGGWSRNCL